MRSVLRSAPFKFFLTLLTAFCLLLTMLAGTASVLLELSGVYDGNDPVKQIVDQRVLSYTNETFEGFLYGWEPSYTDPNFVYAIDDLVNIGNTVENTGIEGAENLQTVYWLRTMDRYGVERDSFYYDSDATIDLSDDTTDVAEAYRITGGYRKDPVERGRLYETVRFLRITVNARNLLPVVAAVAFLLTAAGIVCLCNLAGRRPDSEEIVLNRWDRVPSDLLLAIIGLMGFGIVVAVIILGKTGSVRLFLTGTGLLGAIAALIAVGTVYTAAARIKGGTLIKGSLIYRFLRWLIAVIRKNVSRIRTLISAVPAVPVTAAVMGILGVGNVFLGILSKDMGVCILLLIEWGLLFIIAVLFAWGFSHLQKKTKAIARGDLDAKIETKYLYGPLKVQAEDLNCIGDGLNAAVMERTKSERMKTELISNVSHDIKTPLTSIVNYTDLLSKEEGLSEQAAEYLNVLQRQSTRLKKLTEDIVEASKASSGAITLEPAPCDLGVLLEQAVAEYETKTAEKRLTVLLSKPEDTLTVIADGRRLWRVFDNLINNVCKYALEGTRVYLDLTEENGTARITFRNISKEPLNMNPEELTERFVRGDRSRNTEGSGLGLSIARSLTELQRGTFAVSSDGDLFKVTIEFPIAK